MHGFGKSSMWTAAGFAFVGGLVLLQPTEASAQFNIEGIIRGALQQQGCCYGGGGGYYRNRSSGSGATRHVKSPQKDDSAPAPVDKTKERDATQVESPNTTTSPAGGNSHPPRHRRNPTPRRGRPARRTATTTSRPSRHRVDPKICRSEDLLFDGGEPVQGALGFDAAVADGLGVLVDGVLVALIDA